MQQNDKVLAVESIRGIACFMVVLSHIGLTFFPYLHSFDGLKVVAENNPIQYFVHHSPFTFFFSGTAAVYIFFVLSGYILTKVALQKNDPLRIVSMSLKRYPRLMIPSLVSCIIAVFSFILFDIESDNLSYWIYRYGDFVYSIPNAIYAGIFVSFFEGGNVYNPVLWTMQIELIGSFIIYFLCFNKIKFNIPYIALVIYTLIIIGFALDYLRLSFTLGMLCFYVGYLYALYGREISLKYSLVLLFIGCYLAGTHNTSHSYLWMANIFGNKTYEIGNFLSGLIFVYIFIFNLALSQRIVSKLTVFMGKVSFSVYLIHMPILSIFSVYTFEFLFSVSQWYVTSTLLTAILTIVLTYFLAIYYYKFFDAPGIKISHIFASHTIKILRIMYKKISV